LVCRFRRPVRGIVLLRFHIRDRAWKIPRMRWLIRQYGERIPGAFVVLELNRVRFRPLPE
jgi:hypothetical protein